jgi:hypothetical protein
MRFSDFLILKEKAGTGVNGTVSIGQLSYGDKTLYAIKKMDKSRTDEETIKQEADVSAIRQA